MAVQSLRIFVSSPSDVAEERVLVLRAIERLQRERLGHLELIPVLWEHEPLLASAGTQQQIPRPSDCDIVICILWARLGTRLPEALRRSDGSTYESGTAFEFEDALDGFQRQGRPDLLVYRKTTPPVLNLDRVEEVMERLEQKQALDRFMAKWFYDPEEGVGRTPFHPFTHSAQFEELVLKHLRKLCDRYMTDTAGVAAVAAHVNRAWLEGSPYRGLDVFQPEHAAVFCGRTRAVGEILQAMRRQIVNHRAFVLVIGNSGAGKSSLIRAGVLPLLTQPGVMEGIGLWRHAILRPSDSTGDLADGLAAALLRPEALPELAADGTDAMELARLLRDTPATAAALIKGALSQAAAELQRRDQLDRQPEARLALVIDQMEEIFTLDRLTQEQRTNFIEVIDSLARSGRAIVLATLRSDLYPRVQELPALLDLKAGDGLYDLLPPMAAELGQMIREPAHAAGLSFEVHPETGLGLDDLLLNTSVAHPEMLPLLEFTLDALYEHRTARGVLTYAAYDELGGLDGAIAHQAERTFRQLRPEAQAGFARIFRHLVSLGSGEEDAVARQPARLDQLYAAPAGREFVEQFIEARLFTSGRADDGTPIVTVAHEALLRHWPRLQAWLQEDRELLRIKSRVQAAAARWDAEGRHIDLLLPDGKLLEEARLLQHAESGLGFLSNEFLKASLAQADRRQGRRRVGILLLAIFAGIATVSAILALSANQRTHKALDLVESEQKQTERQRLLGVAREGILYADKGRVGTAREKLLEATLGLRTEGEVPDWLTIAYWDLFRRHPLPLTEHIAGRPSREIGMSPDGRTVLSVDEPQTALRMWDPLTGKLKQQLVTDEVIDGGDISPDGRFAVATSESGTIFVWDTATGQELHRIQAGSGSMLDIDFTADSKVLAVGGVDEVAWTFDLETGELRQSFAGHNTAIYSVALSPDGKWLFTGSNRTLDRPLRMWDTATGKEIRSFEGHGAGVFGIDCTPDGRKLVSGSYDRSVRVWSLPDGKQLQDMREHSHSVDRLLCLPDNRSALSLSRDGTIRRWDLEAGRSTKTWMGDPSPFISLTFDQSGEHMVTIAQGGRLKLWSLETEPNVLEVPRTRENFNFRSAQIDSAGRWALVTHEDRSVGVWDLATGTKLRSYPNWQLNPTHGALNHAGTKVAMLGDKRDVQFLDLASGEVTAPFFFDTSPIDRGVSQGAGFSRDDTLLLATSGGENNDSGNYGQGTLTAIEVTTGKIKWVQSVAFEDSVPRDVIISPDNTQWMVGTNHQRLVMGQLSDGTPAPPITAESQTISAMYWASPATVYLGGADRTLRAFDPMTKVSTAPLQGHQGRIKEVFPLPDGSGLVSLGEREPVVRVWDLESRQDLVQMPASHGIPEELSANHTRTVWAVPPEIWRTDTAPAYLALSEQLPLALETLASDPGNPDALLSLGQWCHLRGDWGWAREMLLAAKAAGATVPSMTLGQCEWKLGNLAAAQQHYEDALATAKDPQEQWFLEQCLQVIRQGD